MQMSLLEALRHQRVDYPGTNIAVMGGDFIVDSIGKLLHAHHSKNQYDMQTGQWNIAKTVIRTCLELTF